MNFQSVEALGLPDLTLLPENFEPSTVSDVPAGFSPGSVQLDRITEPPGVTGDL
jgi:hypothetical protein